MKGLSLKGLDKAAVLAALYNASHPLGMGFLQYDPEPMTIAEAEEILKDQSYFDYLKGRVMKFDLSQDPLCIRLYDRDNGSGAAETALTYLRETGRVRGGAIKAAHLRGLEDGIGGARRLSGTRTTTEMRGGFAVIQLGCEDVAEELTAAIDKAGEA